MVLLVVVVALLAVVSLVNLLLLAAVVRMLRRGGNRVVTQTPEVPPAGRVVGDFAATDLDGGEVTRTDVATGRTLTLFMSPTCAPCAALLPRLGSAALPTTTLAFVLATADDETTRAYAERLRPYARVAVVPDREAVGDAFGFLGATPTVLLLDDGVVAAAAHDLDVLDTPLPPVPATAAAATAPAEVAAAEPVPAGARER